MGIYPADYAAELNRLVQEGKISPALAAQLLAQYTQQKMREQAKEGAFALQQMAKSGQITQDVAKDLANLQSKNVPVDQYEAELNRLVAQGKMTPAAAAKLLDLYKKQRSGFGAAGLLNDLVAQQQAKADAYIDDLVKSGKISQQDADALRAIDQNAKNAQDCHDGIMKLAQARKLSPEITQQLIQNCQKVAAARAEADKLANMQANNASLDDYTNELKRAVQEGLISPEMAANLLTQYRALLTPITPPGGVAPGVQANIPGATEFGQLQQRVQGEAVAAPPAPAEATQFEVAQTQTQTESLQDRLQRIAQLQSAMASQAQQLIGTAWLPATMHIKKVRHLKKLKRPLKQQQMAQVGQAGKVVRLVKCLLLKREPFYLPYWIQRSIAIIPIHRSWQRLFQVT